mgnify:CR=1 FL=1
MSKRWPLGSVTLENRHLYSREQLQNVGVIVPPLDQVEPRVLHIVEEHLLLAAELVERGSIVVREIYSEGPELVLYGGVVNGGEFDKKAFEDQLKALQRDVDRELAT